MVKRKNKAKPTTQRWRQNLFNFLSYLFFYAKKNTNQMKMSKFTHFRYTAVSLFTAFLLQKMLRYSAKKQRNENDDNVYNFCIKLITNIN